MIRAGHQRFKLRTKVDIVALEWQVRRRRGATRPRAAVDGGPADGLARASGVDSSAPTAVPTGVDA